MTWDEDVRSVRQAIYTSMVESGVVPTPADVARACAIFDARVETMCRALADAHVIVLQPGSTKLWAAPPFSAVPSGRSTRHFRGDRTSRRFLVDLTDGLSRRMCCSSTRR